MQIFYRQFLFTTSHLLVPFTARLALSRPVIGGKNKNEKVVSMQNVKIDVAELAKEVFRDKELSIEELPEDNVKIWYKAPFVTNLKPIILPKNIELDDVFIEAVGLYIADGKTTLNDTRHIEFASIDTDIAKCMLDFFIHRLNVDTKDIYIRIRHSNGNEELLRDKWSKALSVPKSSIAVKIYGKNKTDCCHIQISSRLLRTILGKLLQISLCQILNSEGLIKAFLKGHFAADGGIETRLNKHNLQINHIIFAYHKSKEVWLRDFILVCLEKLGITKVSIKNVKNKETACIRVTLWEYIVKFWEIGLFDLCERKKDIFLKAMDKSSFYLKLSREFHDKLFSLNKTQREVAKIINCKSEGETCDTIHGRHLLKLEQINNLLKFTNFTWEDILENATSLRVGQRGYLHPNRCFINFVLSKRNLV